jgi:hypothetical protein
MGDRLFTGAETVAALVAAAGLRSAFAYPGTSELELCRQLDAAGIRLHNSRGDAEAVFMAAGALGRGEVLGRSLRRRALHPEPGRVAHHPLNATRPGACGSIGWAGATASPLARRTWPR